MKTRLLDVNILLALAWRTADAHRRVTDWFGDRGGRAFATCPITESGFVRISSNPSFYREAVGAASARHALTRIAALPGHVFWPDDLPLEQGLTGFPLNGHRQLTDAYLLGLARAKGGVVATLDRGLVELAGEDSGLVELLL